MVPFIPRRQRSPFPTLYIRREARHPDSYQGLIANPSNNMEDCYLFHTPQTLFMDSIPRDLMNNNTFDTTITNYDHVFNEFMLFGNEYDRNELWLKSENMFNGEGEGTSNFGLRIDAVKDSTDVYLSVDGNAPASRAAEESSEEKQGDGNSSGGTTRVAKLRRDRSKTLISERRRRGRMKEKLYELRSLVPNITKVCPLINIIQTSWSKT